MSSQATHLVHLAPSWPTEPLSIATWERVWGWCYQTLEGHLEQGRLSYEVIKHLTTGQVAFRVAGYSRPAPIGNPIVRLGFFWPVNPAALLPEHPGADH